MTSLGGDRPGVEWVDPSPGWPDVPPPPVLPGHRRGGSLRRVGARTWIVVAAIAAVAAAGAGTWFALTPAPPVRITYNGATVDNAKALLTSVDASFLRYTHSQLGVASRQSRCYFHRTGSRVTSDVAPTVFCGPALFYDGTTTRPYLAYTVSSESTARRGHVTFAARATPDSPDPVAAPGALVRPDRRRPPSHAGGLTVPIPPAGAADLLTSVAASDVSPPFATNTEALIGSRNFGVRLSAYGVVPDYGRLAKARSAAPGHKLIAFAVDMRDGERGPVSTTHPHLGVSVDGRPARAISVPPVQGVDYYFVASVPATARSVDLVATDAGVTQRLSLLDGTPAATNIAVLRRGSRYESSAATGVAAGRVATGGLLFSAPLTIHVSGAALEYFTPQGPHPSSPQRAFLYVALCYQSSVFQDPVSCHSFRASDLELTVPGGRPTHPRDIGSNDVDYPVWDVPATFTTGTLTVTGSESSGNGWRMTITRSFRYAISIPE